MFMLNNDWVPNFVRKSLSNKGLPSGRWEAPRVFKNTQHKIDWDLGRTRIAPRLLPDFDNGITDEGIHYLLDGGFRGTATISAWYAGLIDSVGFTGVNASDVMSSHTGWSVTGDYSESVRQTLAFGAAASRAITAEVSFTMSADKTINGIFVVSVNTKATTTGTLWSTALFASAPVLTTGNVLTSNYTLSD